MHSTHASHPVMTVGHLAAKHGLSRTALLYYARLGLLKPSRRSAAGYRLYSPADEQRLERICFYRKMGVPLKDIALLVAGTEGEASAQDLLRRRLGRLDAEIASLRAQQAQVLQLLTQMKMSRSASARGSNTGIPRAQNTGRRTVVPDNKEIEMISKERWVEIMTAAGFDETARRKWHEQFERMEPEAHDEFLLSLGIPPQAVQRIRRASRS